MDIELVKEQYQKMTDEELLRIITQDATGLTDEALNIIESKACIL